MRNTIDGTHEALQKVLSDLLAEGVDVTAREVARRHPLLRNASAFTRHAERMELIARAQCRQKDAMNLQATPAAQRSATLTEQLAVKSARITELEKQVSSLVASHAACVRAVMQHGGMRSLHRFWVDYSAIAGELEALGALPSLTQVISLERQSGPLG